MKTTLDISEDLMMEVKIRAARQKRKMKDIIEDALRRELGLEGIPARHSIRDIKPLKAGNMIKRTGSEDKLEEMLDDRGHPY